jgi:DNA-binding transcriptional ArsR family regulator
MSPLNATFRALADPTRREILRRLAGGDLSAGEIAAGFTISKPSVSHHLTILKAAGLVLDVRRGQSIIYSLNTTVVQDVFGWLLDVTGRGTTTKEDGDAQQ